MWFRLNKRSNKSQCPPQLIQRSVAINYRNVCGLVGNLRHTSFTPANSSNEQIQNDECERYRPAMRFATEITQCGLVARPPEPTTDRFHAFALQFHNSSHVGLRQFGQKGFVHPRFEYYHKNYFIKIL